MLDNPDFDVKDKIAQELGLHKLKVMRQKILNETLVSSSKIMFLKKKLDVFKFINSYLDSNNGTFNTTKLLFGHLLDIHGTKLISYSSFYRIIKESGLKFKTIKNHTNQTKQLKLARIHFFCQYVKIMGDNITECLYFDWTSFAESNFKQKAWAHGSNSAVVNTLYSYSKLHLLVILGPTKVITFQFVKGTLKSEIIFDILLSTFNNILNYIEGEVPPRVLVLDNSPLNHSTTIYNFFIDRNIKLLYTAPFSSFLNPIEFVFVKVKAPLKSIYCTNKYSN